MDLSLVADPITLATQQQGLGFSNSFIHRQNLILNINIAVSARGIFDAIAPPPVKSTSRKTIRRTLLRKKRRTRRRSHTGGGDSEEGGGEDFGFFGGDKDDGAFSGGSGGGNWSGGGRGWNFDKFGGQNWDESSSSWWSSSKFAYGFVYEVIYWIALSNCLHFAFEKVSRLMADSEREKVTMRLTSVC